MTSTPTWGLNPRGSAAAAFLVGAALLAIAAPAAATPNPWIAGVQVALARQGVYGGDVDGAPGPRTRAAIRVAQQRAGLPVTGIADARTVASLGPFGRPALGSRILARGAVGLDVAILQFRLALRGFPSGDFDGIFGPRTEGAVRRFQSWFAMPPDGIVGRAMYVALHAPLQASPLQLSWPLTGYLTSGFGPRGHRFHAGIDIASPTGTSVRVAAPGRIVWAGWRDGGWGQLVVVAHRRGVRTMYAHLSRVDVRLGQQMEARGGVGLVGESGSAEGPHLHFEVRLRGAAVDPRPALADEARSTSSTGLAARALVRRRLSDWARRFDVDPCLAHALARLGSAYQPGVVSAGGAIGVTPATWVFVERSVIGGPVRPTVDGSVRVGVAYLDYLLRVFGRPRLALAAYRQGPRALRARGVLPGTRRFAGNVLALRNRLRNRMGPSCARAR